MTDSYIQSEEEYMGFVLKIHMDNWDSSHPFVFHRRCTAYKDGKSVATGKTKKEMKDLIKYGYIK